MLLFQTHKKEEKKDPLFNIVPIKKQNVVGLELIPGWNASSSGDYGIDLGSKFFVKYGDAYISASPVVKIAKGGKVELTGLFCLSLPTGSLIVDYSKLAGVGITLKSNTGIGITYSKRLDEILTGNYHFEVSGLGGPAGDVYSIAKLFKALKAGGASISTWISGLKGIADFIYSIFKPIVESIGSFITEKPAPPSKETLDKLHNPSDSNPLTITECLSILQWEGCSKEDRTDAATMLSVLLMADLYNLGSGKDSKLSLSDWDKLMPILQKNREFFGSSLGEIEQVLDAIRLGAPSGAAFTPFSGGLVGNIANALLGSIFNVEEYTLVLPRLYKLLNLFDGVFSFRNTKNAEGFFGKIGGFFLDVINMPLQLASNLWSAVSPLQRKSDVRADKVKENIRSKLEWNEATLRKGGEKITEQERIQLYSNLIYLTNMLPLLATSGDSQLEELAERITKHITGDKKNSTFYSVLMARMTRAEIGTEKEKGSLMWKLANAKTDKEKQDAIDKLNSAFTSLNNIYLRLQSIGYEGLDKSLAIELAREKMFIRRHLEYLNKIRKKMKLEDQIPDWKEVGNTLKNFYNDLQSGKAAEMWKKVANIFKSGNFYSSTLTKEEEEAMTYVMSLAAYAEKYSVLGDLLESWSGKQDQNLAKQAFNSLIKLIESEAKEGNFEHLFYLQAFDKLFPNIVKNYEGSEVLEDAIEKYVKDMTVSAGDLKSQDARQLFFNGFYLSLNLIYGLCQFTNFSAIDNKTLKEWATEKLPDALRTLYEVIKSSKDAGNSSDYDAACSLLYNATMVAQPIANRYGVNIFSGFSGSELTMLRNEIGYWIAAKTKSLQEQSKK
ncbi:MAG: hypothetical protein N3E51_03330 [Candidatus Micrarchaeota archaeon]|nr:hypothetical protein [Candidatus Micrarchaeota archaeon]